MRNVKWLVPVAVLVSATGCVENYGYPTTSYGYNGYNTGYGYNSGYYAQPRYYSQPSFYSQPSYYPQQPTYSYQPRPAYQQVGQPSYRRYRDRDRDGIPDRYDRDKNGDGIPDRYQR